MGTPVTLTTDRRGDGTPVLIATGELDMSNVETLTQALRNVTGESDKVTVDLSAVQYLDSAAINALFSFVEQIDIVAGPLLMPVLNVSGLTQAVRVRPPP